MNQELPEGWASPSVSDSCERVVVGFVGPSAKHYSAEGVPFLTGKNVRPGRLVLSDFDRVTNTFHSRERKSQLAPGDVVVVRIGRSGEAAVIPDSLGEANCGGLVIAKKPRAALPTYLAWYLNSPQGQSQLLEEVRGVTRQTLNTRSIARARVPLAPLAEQRRIVAKVEALLERVNRARDRFAKVPLILKRFRQAVLAAACSGKLTEEWRAWEGAGERGLDLLRVIESERQTYGQRSRRGVREEESEVILTPVEWDVPDSWTWTHLASLLTPERPAAYGVLQPGVNKADGVPFVRICDLANATVQIQDLKRIAKTVDNQYPRTRLKGGELLVSLVGTIGRTAIAPPGIAGANVARAIAVLPLSRHVSAFYVHCCLQVPSKADELSGLAREVARKTLNLGLLKAVRVPLPPPREQAEIVRAVKALFAVADSIERRMMVATERVTMLPQAILLKAFSGELVPTEAELARSEGREYESASALLARLLKSAVAGTTNRKTTKNRKTRAKFAGEN